MADPPVLDPVPGIPIQLPNPDPGPPFPPLPVRTHIPTDIPASLELIEEFRDVIEEEKIAAHRLSDDGPYFLFRGRVILLNQVLSPRPIVPPPDVIAPV